MSRFGELIEARKDVLLARWLDRVRLEAVAGGLSTVELRDHVPLFVREICDALHGGLAPSSSNAAKEHGRQREALGFDVDAVVWEYGLLLDVIFDLADAEGFAPGIADVRVVTRFISLGIKESVAAHRRHQDRISLGHEQMAATEQLRADAATRRLVELFHTAPAFMAALQGPTHVFRLVNEPYGRIVGVDRPLLGLAVGEALPEMVAQGFIDLLDAVYRSGTAHAGREVEVRFDRHGNGLETAFIDFVYQPTRDASGTVDGIDVFGFDVSVQVEARRRVEALVLDVRAKEAEIKSVIDALPVLVSFVGTDERYRLVNKAYETWFGVDAAALRGQHIAELIGPAAYAVLGPHVKRAIAGERFRFEQQGVPYRLGGARDIAVSFIPRPNSAGEIDGYVALLEDVTERRRKDVEREQLLLSERAARHEADIQRERLRILVATAPIGIATWHGPLHVFESANALYLRAFDRPAAILGQTLSQAFPELPPDDSAFTVFDAVYRTGEPFVDPEYRVTHLVDGSVQARVYVFHLTPVRDLDGATSGLMASLSDVTEVVRLRELVEVERDLANAVAELETTSREASEEARARTEFLLSVAAALGESLDIDVILRRVVERLAPTHAMLATLWTRAPGEPLRRRAHAPIVPVLLDPSTPPSSKHDNAVSVPVLRVFETGELLRLDDYQAWMTAERAKDTGLALTAQKIRSALFLPIRRGAEVIAVVALARPILAAFTDEDVEVFEFVTRLTALAYENARLFGEMAQLRQAAEDATVAKDRFLAHVSHDLRNPLSSILGWSTLLREMPDVPPQMKRGIDVIERNAKSQQQLIEDLLDVSRIASGKVALVMAVEYVRSAIDAALDAARLAAAAKKVKLVVKVEDEIGAIAVDPDRFRQIVWNLVSNAVKFTPNGGTVELRAQRIGPVFRLVVEDSGRGIPSEFLLRVFDTFEQAEAGSRRTGGLGLGLAIVKKLVELHRGTIRVESGGEGKGARFTVDLPIRAAVESLDAPQSDTPAPLTGIRLLVVDDEEEARDVITIVLEHAGATVTGASSVDEALDLLLATPLDAVVSDIAMPGRDGKELVREVRSLPASQGGTLPVIALTAFVSRRDRQEILAAGFDAHVAKPVEAAELVGKISELVGRKLTESRRYS